MKRNVIAPLLAVLLVCYVSYALLGGRDFAAASTAKPTTPTALSAGAVTVSSLTLSWKASTDSLGITSYTVYKGSAVAGTSKTTSLAISGLSPNTSYTFTVVATDAAKNLSAASAPLVVSTLKDTQPPSAPANLKAVISTLGTAVTLTWSAAVDNVGVTGYKVFENSNLVGTVTTTGVVVNSLLPSTSYSFAVKATDVAGNLSASSAALAVTTPVPTAAAFPRNDSPKPATINIPYSSGLHLTGGAPVAMTDYQIYLAISSAVMLNLQYSGIQVGNNGDQALKIAQYFADYFPEYFSGYSDADVKAKTGYTSYIGGILSFPTMTQAEINKVTNGLQFAYNLTKQLNLLNIADMGQRAQAINNWLVQNATYDTANYNAGTVTRDDRTAYGIFTNKKGVCAGFAAAFNAIANYGGGMTSHVLKGNAMFPNGVTAGHSWNIFISDSAYTLSATTPLPKMLQIDTTWNDTAQTNQYTNLTDLQMNHTSPAHLWDPAEYPGTWNVW